MEPILVLRYGPSMGAITIDILSLDRRTGVALQTQLYRSLREAILTRLIEGTATKARLALDLLIYTGARRSDVIRLGRQNVKGQVLSFIAFKGRNKAPVQVDLPILAELAAALDVGPVGDMVFLVTEHGKPYTHAGFGNWFRRQCDEAGLKGRSAHGLRKAASVTAAENGATPHELQAIFGWKTLKEAERYTTAANRKDLAMRSPHLLSRADREQKSLTSSAQTPPVRENGRKV
jgi:integrase